MPVKSRASDDGKHRKAYVFNAVFAVRHSGNGERRVCGVVDAVYDVRDRNRHGIKGSPFALDNLSARASDIGFDFFVNERRDEFIVVFETGFIFVDGNRRDICKRPRNKRRISVFTENVRVYVLLCDAVVFGNACAKAGSVEDRSRTENLILRQSRHFVKLICQNIDRIRNNHVNRRRSILDDFGDDALRDVDIRLRQIQPGLSGLPRDARCQNDDVRILCIGVCPCIDGYGVAERRTLPDVKRFAQSFLRVDIDHYDFGRDAFNGERIRDRRAYLTGSDDRDFECQFLFLCTATLLQQVLYGDCSLLCRRHIHKKIIKHYSGNVKQKK